MGRAAIIALFGLMSFGIAVEAVTTLADAISGPTLRAWLDVAYTALKAGVILAFTVFVVKRGPARRRTREPFAFVACTAAIVSVVALERPDSSTAAALVIGGETLALVSCGWMLASALALGRCFGVLPEARGLVTRGPYRLVRHPLYLGEFGACVGLVVASPSGRNLVAAVVFTFAQVARMRMEERELTHQFPEYAAYAERTPRLIPLPRLARRRAPVTGVPVGQGEAA
jgi:protein-S-isoprenylcysteine O-methyltransferase Ste14